MKGFFRLMATICTVVAIAKLVTQDWIPCVFLFAFAWYLFNDEEGK